MHLMEMRKQQVDAAGFLTCLGVLHPAARDDQFWDEPDHDDAAVFSHVELQNRLSAM
jgi:hypothetical protein